MFVTPLFKLMADKKASDLFFSSGSPIQIKINGTVKIGRASCRERV